MIQYIFNESPKVSELDKILPIVCVILGAVLGFFLNFFYDLFKEHRANQKGKKEFLEIKNEMPEIIEVVKRGLRKYPLEYKIYYKPGTTIIQEGSKTTVQHLIDHAIHFGVEEELFPKRDIYVQQVEKLKHLGLADFEKITEVTLLQDFLNKIKKWG